MSSQPVILVTGASSGIGEATARLFAREGYRVAMGARRLDRLETLANEIQTSGGQALPVAADLSRLEDIQSLVTTTLDHYGQIDVLLNNAGFGRLDWLENLDPVKDIEAQLRINLIAVIQTAREVLPHMIKRRSGHIVNMASMAGQVATPTYTVYAASKFAVRGFTEALRREVGVYGVHVSAIYPGANAKTTAETVATPIEQEINGVERMLYMSSRCTNDGQMLLDVTFEVGTDLDMAQVLVQNRVAIAEAKLPEDVKRQGVALNNQAAALQDLKRVAVTTVPYQLVTHRNGKIASVAHAATAVSGSARSSPDARA